MKRINFIIPNSLTLINLLCGSIATLLFFEGYFLTGVLLLLVSAIADVLDGLTAKLLKATSEFGKQLDSLSDLISFGLAPSVLMYKMVYSAIDDRGISFSLQTASPYQLLLLFSTFSLAVFAALRLARFNIDTSSSPDFKGMPVPANALIVIGVWISSTFSNSFVAKAFSENEYVLLLITALLSFMMISSIPMISFKFANFKFWENIWRYLTIVGSIFLIIAFGFASLILVMAFYIALSILKAIFSKSFNKS